MIEYVVNEEETIKAKNFDSLMDKCDKKEINIDIVTVNGIIIAERLKETKCESTGLKAG